ncbi:MAG: hypothetical protein J6I73_00305 [Treponema sp.]|nr:hypothetical protein [Treponema sp.]
MNSIVERLPYRQGEFFTIIFAKKCQKAEVNSHKILLFLNIFTYRLRPRERARVQFLKTALAVHGGAPVVRRSTEALQGGFFQQLRPKKSFNTNKK